jgi:hypothetical protein
MLIYLNNKTYQGLGILLTNAGENANILNWERRLRIAMDAAQG